MLELYMKKEYCKACPYFEKEEVPYAGSLEAECLIVGESPGVDEIGASPRMPFVGRSGKLLNKLLETIKIPRSTVFLANSCRCMIEKNIDSTKNINTAMKHCRSFLEKAIHSIKPKVIVSLGAYALKQLLGKQKIMQHRGKVIFSDEFNCPVVITVHPSYILRQGVSAEYPYQPYNLMSMTEKLLFNDFKIISQLFENDFSELVINSEDYKKASKVIVPPDCKVVAIDYETTGLSPFNKSTFKILSLSVSHKEGEAQIFLPPFDSSVIELLKNPKIAKVVMSRPFEEAVTKASLKFELKGKLHDVALMAHLIDENYYSYSLEEIANTYTPLKNIKELAEGYRTNLQDANEETLIRYSGVDADATMRCFRTLSKELIKDTKITNYYTNFILPAQELFFDTYMNGCLIDKNMLTEANNEADTLLTSLHDECLSYVHESIKEKYTDNLSLTRPAFVKDILFYAEKGLKRKPDPFYITAKTKEPQINEEHLRALKSHKFITKFLDWKKLLKIKTGYLNTLHKEIHEDGLAHTSTLLYKTVSGRTATYNPPLHQLPVRHPYAYLIRKCFIVEDGWVLGVRDLSQSELRIMGWLAGDRNILNAVNNGIDLHRQTASIINHNIPLDKVTKDMRQKAKGINFGLMYGLSAKGLKQYVKSDYDVDMTLKEAEATRTAFFANPNGYYKLPAFYAYQEHFLIKHKYVRSPLGRKRRLPDIDSNEYKYRSKAIRQCINFPVSSFSSDLGIIGFFLFNQEIKTNRKLKNKVKSMLFTHDACMFRAKEDVFDDAALLLKECLCDRSKEYIKTYFNILVGYKIESDRKQGTNWNELKEVKD